MFVDRTGELEGLERGYRGRAARLVVIYGRRRVGKTALLTEFARGKSALQYTAEEATESVLLQQLSERAAEASGQRYLAEAPFRTWEAFFGFLVEWAQRRRRLVILDEFPYLLQASPGLASRLQKAWDERLKDIALMLVLCGSYVSVMEQEVLGHRSPLYGRRTGQLRLAPLDFFDASLMLRSSPIARRVEAYAVLGGMPAYVAQFDARLDVFENIARHVLRREAFLYDEPRFVLLQELREPRVYFSILRALAFGDTRLNDIAQHVGLDRTAVARYLDLLRALSLVDRHVPITEGAPEKSRKGLYQICDLFFRFWFRFVYPHATDLEAGRSEAVLQQRIRPAFSTFVGPVFEEVCRQWLRRVEGTPAWPVRYRALGRWWDREHEIDLVGLGERGEILFGECKWSEKPVGIDVLESLRATSRLVPVEANPEQAVYVLFSKSGFTEAVKRQEGSNVRLVGLQEIGAP